MKTAAILMSVLWCALSATGALAEAELTQIHLVSESWERTTNADGSGLYWEIFRAVYEPLGIAVTFDIVPYTRAVKMVESQKADASIAAYIDEFDAIFPKWHFDRDIVVAVFKKGAVGQWDGETSLNGRLGWMRGYEYGQYLKKEYEFIEVDNRKSAFKMIQFGHLDFFLDAIEEVRNELPKSDIAREEFQIETVLKLNLFLAFANNERGRRLQELFDERMTELVASGELKPLFEKWNILYPFDE